MESKSFSNLIDTIKKLRDPNGGCPWDLKQDIKSLAPSLLEECCECIDGASNNDLTNVKEELGDIIFTATLMTYIIEQNKNGSVDEIINTVNEKMIRRHPHVFADREGIETSEAVLEQWEQIKTKVEGRKRETLLAKIPSSLPAMEKSWEIQKKVAKVGFDWEEVQDIFHKITEETEEVKEEIKTGDSDKMEEEIGDLLFSVINLARFLKINPTVALSRTNNKFVKRFSYVESEMIKNGKEMSKEQFSEMDRLWELSKIET